MPPASLRRDYPIFKRYNEFGKGILFHARIAAADPRIHVDPHK
jgi:hypothetical protein